MDIDVGQKFLGPAYFVEHEVIFAQEAPDPRVVLQKEDNLSVFPFFHSPKHLLP